MHRFSHFEKHTFEGYHPRFCKEVTDNVYGISSFRVVVKAVKRWIKLGLSFYGEWVVIIFQNLLKSSGFDARKLKLKEGTFRSSLLKHSMSKTKSSDKNEAVRTIDRKLNISLQIIILNCVLYSNYIHHFASKSK